LNSKLDPTRIPHPWILLGSNLAYPGLDSSLLELKVLIPLWTRTPSQFRLVFSIFFWSSPGQLTWVTFTYRLTQISPEQLIRNSFKRLTRALADRINAYPALYIHTLLSYLTRFFSQSNFYLPGLTRSYLAELPYSIFSRLDFCLPNHTRPPFLTSSLGRVTLRCTQLLTRAYAITLPGRVPFNWPHPKNSSSASHLNLCLIWPTMHQDSSGNPKPTRVTLKHPGNPICLTEDQIYCTQPYPSLT
jgi:hypothetical protein